MYVCTPDEDLMSEEVREGIRSHGNGITGGCETQMGVGSRLGF